MGARGRLRGWVASAVWLLARGTASAAPEPGTAVRPPVPAVAAVPELAPQLGHQGTVDCVAYSPDGRILASAGGREVILWDVATGYELCRLEAHDGFVICLALSPDGRTLATGGGGTFNRPTDDNSVKLWAVPSGRLLHTLGGDTNAVLALAFSPDGRTLAAASGVAIQGLDGATAAQDRSGVSLYDVGRGSLARRLPGVGAVRAVAFSPDGKLLACGGDDGLTVWDTGAPAPAGGLPDVAGRRMPDGPGPAVHALAFTPDGHLATGDERGGVALWDAAAGQVIWRRQEHGDLVRGLAFSPDGGVLASGGGGQFEDGDTAIRLWNVATGEVHRRLEGQPGEVYSLDFSPDGGCLAVAASSHEVRVWDLRAERYRPPLRGRTCQVAEVGFAPDGRTVCACVGRAVVRYDCTTGALVGGLEAGDAEAECLAFSPEGALLAVGCSDGAVLLERQREGRPRRRLAAVALSGLAAGQAADKEAVQRLWNEGAARFIEGDLFGALGRWDEALKLDPQNQAIKDKVVRTREQLREAGYLRVADGASVMVTMAGKEATVRLVGLDVAGQSGTAAFLQGLVEARPLFVWLESGGAGEDGPAAGYPYRSPDGLCVNLELLRQGQARLDRRHPGRFETAFAAAEAEAKAAGKGLWAVAAAPPPAAAVAPVGKGAWWSQPVAERPVAPGLWAAAWAGDLAQVKAALGGNGDANAKDAYGWTALHYAALAGHTEVVEELLRRGGTDREAKTNEGWTPGMVALLTASEAVDSLYGSTANALQAMTQPPGDEQNGWYVVTAQAMPELLLHRAAALLRAAMESIVSGSYGRADAINREVQTLNAAMKPLVEARSKAAQAMLLGLRSDDLGLRRMILLALDTATSNGSSTMLHFWGARDFLSLLETACQGMPPEVATAGRRAAHRIAVQMLLDAGLEEDTKDLTTLLADGLAPESRAADGRTALHTAAQAGNTAAIDLLLQHGAQGSVRDEDGRTPLHGAAAAGEDEAVRLLLDRGVPVDARDGGGQTPLHAAAAAGKAATVRLLLDRGADIAAQDAEGKTALALAEKDGEVQTLLRQRGAK